MEEVIIEKGIQPKNPPFLKYDFSQMEIGCSLYVPVGDRYKSTHSLRIALLTRAKERMPKGLDYKFRTEIENDGVRIFRLW